MSKREAFVAKALEYHGYNEADGSHRIIVDLYNGIKPLPVGYKLSYSDPWCAAFVSVISNFKVEGNPLLIIILETKGSFF